MPDLPNWMHETRIIADVLDVVVDGDAGMAAADGGWSILSSVDVRI